MGKDSMPALLHSCYGLVPDTGKEVQRVGKKGVVGERE